MTVILVVIIFNYISYRETPEEMSVYENDRTLGDLLAEKGADNVDLPDVDVFVTTCREPVELLEQTPQAFYTEDLYQSTFAVGKIVPNEQDQFYRNLQPCRSAVNAVICCGSNTVMLRKALEEVGLFTEETITEDFATGLKIRKAGYRSRAIDRTLAEGTTPDNFRAPAMLSSKSGSWP